MLAKLSGGFSGENHRYNRRSQRDNHGYDESRFNDLTFNSQSVYGGC
jgi:hypothetical protein